jgi:plasmid maintenance system antidote protein VapI
MKIEVFQPPLPEMMSEGGEIEVPKMRRGGMGFSPKSIIPNIDEAEIQRRINESVRDAIGGQITSEDIDSQIREYLAGLDQVGLGDVQSEIQEAIAGLPQIGLGDVQSEIQEAIAGLPQGITEQQVQSLIDANPNLSREDVIRLIQENPGITAADVQSQISEAVSGLPEGITEADVQRIVEANPGLTEDMVLTLIRNNQGVSLQDIENAISTAMANIPSAQENEQRLREIAEELFEEDYQRDPFQGDFEGSKQAELEQFVADFIADRVGDPLASTDIQSLIQQQIDAGLASGDIASGGVAGDITQSLQEMIAEGTLTPEEIQRRIDAGDITKEDVLAIIQGGFDLSESQFAQLFNAGILTRDEIAALVEGAIAEAEIGDDDALTEEQVEAIVEQTGLTEEQVQQLIGEQLGEFDPNIDLSQYATQDMLGDYATQEQFVTPDQLAEATKNDYDATIKALTDKLGDLETKYQDVQSQYEADAVNQQIQSTKDDLDTFFRGAVPSGPRTGSTSQFSSGASFLPGGSPMANLIGGQREGFGQDAFSTYLKTFTPSYGEYQAPFTAEEYGQGSSPLLGTQYSNPFTGGSYNQGGQVNNGIMDLTNFDTNVAPFQNAFRPNVPRN